MNVRRSLSYFLLLTTLSWTDALLCYSCNDLKSNEVCFNVTSCPDGEACYGRADGFPTAAVKHTTGCTKELKPPKRTDTSGFTFCSKACQGDLCNLQSCQLGNNTRPPRCLSCDFVDSPRECKTIVECKTHEVCFSEKFSTFQKTKYRFGCVSETDCDLNPINSLAILGKRTGGNTCSVCCKTDHCNLNACNHNPTGDVFRLKPVSPGAPCVDTDNVLCATLGKLSANACKETSIIKTCPKSCAACSHVGWNSWQQWSSCSKSCNAGHQTRSRTCTQRFNFVKSVPCVGSSVDSKDCLLKYCPVNGGWCYKTYTSCESHYHYLYGTERTCSDSNQRTTCSCPSPAHGGSYCH